MSEQKNTVINNDGGKVFNREKCLSRINALITHKQQLANEIQVKLINDKTVIPSYLTLEQAFREAIYSEITILLTLK